MFKKKGSDSATEERTSAAQETAEPMDDIETIMKKYDRESNTRIFTGTPRLLVRYFFIAFSLFCIGMNLFANWDERIRRASFLGLIIIMVFILFPARKYNPTRVGAKAPKVNCIPWYDMVIGLVGAACYFYCVFNSEAIISRSSRILPYEIVIGIVGALVLFEACRRVVGLPILCVASVFLIYAFSQYYNLQYFGLKRIIYQLFYTTNGILGTPINVCSTFIVLFIIFGAFLEATGISQFFIQCANAIAGSSSGGPAKVAVISSALCGMVSGSSVGNTVTTGSVTIPLMKKTGYAPEFAGAVEAAASTGGQIMPPIMGAAAFLMAEMVGVPYQEIAVKAILPAFLYFSGIFLMVHFEAKKLGLKGLSRDELPKLGKLMTRIYLLLPLVILIVTIIQGFTMSRAAILATLVAIAVSIANNFVDKMLGVKSEHEMNIHKFFDGLENGAKNTISVAVACGIAGIIAGVVTMTGLGQVLISAIVSVAGDKLIVGLFLTMLTCILLGMGVPTTANYVIMATTCAPILISGMGLNAIAANMFVFYFGIVADITPPVALAAYAGSAIARANPMKTGVNAARLAIAAFIVPYIFALNPAMLFIDTTPLAVVQIIVTSFIGMFSIAGCLEGYMFRHLNWFQRIVLLAAGLMLISPTTITDVIGLTIAGVMIAWQLIANRTAPKAA